VNEPPALTCSTPTRPGLGVPEHVPIEHLSPDVHSSPSSHGSVLNDHEVGTETSHSSQSFEGFRSSSP
jgi:hypothetical protein